MTGAWATKGRLWTSARSARPKRRFAGERQRVQVWELREVAQKSEAEAEAQEKSRKRKRAKAARQKGKAARKAMGDIKSFRN